MSKPGLFQRLFGRKEADEAAADRPDEAAAELYPQSEEQPAETRAEEPQPIETEAVGRLEPVMEAKVVIPEASPVIEPEPEPEPTPESELAAEAAEPARSGWFTRLRAGLSKSSSRLTKGLTDLFTKRKLDADALQDLEDLLITADLGVGAANRVTTRLASQRFGQEVDDQEIREALADEVTTILEPVAKALDPDKERKPHVVLVVGVNGSGKTTTIGKLAKQYRDQGLSVCLAAGDTFRAAAVEQLKVWGERTGCPVIARATGSDAAGLAFDALAEARNRGDDILFIDTAGRLQNKSDLMAELQKVVRVIKKHDESAPHDVLLVLDATVGQNAHSQVEVFRDMVNVTGLVLTKLDGTARGGVLVALAERFGLPVHAIGVGEKADDLRPFEARAFARSLVGLD